MSDRIFSKGAVLTVLTLAVAACGDSGGGNDGGGVGGGPGPSQDSFFTVVKAVVATSPDDTEPREIDSITATSPESSEPAALDS